MVKEWQHYTMAQIVTVGHMLSLSSTRSVWAYETEELEEEQDQGGSTQLFCITLNSSL